jgi:hypothetical protein
LHPDGWDVTTVGIVRVDQADRVDSIVECEIDEVVDVEREIAGPRQLVEKALLIRQEVFVVR